MKINQIIKNKRKELMMTQMDIANYLGVTTPAVSKWEKGSSYPDITLLPPLARLLKIDLNTLLAFNENLSDVEIRNIIKVLEEKIENENYDTGFQYAISSINEFPTCVDLIFNVVLSLIAYLPTLPTIDQNTYKNKITKLYSRLLNSEVPKIRKEAVTYIFTQHIENKEYEQAEKIIDHLLTDKKVLLGTLYMEKENYLIASKLFEQRLLENTLENHTILNNMVKIAYAKNNIEHANKLLNKLSEMINIFDLMDCTAFVPQFEIAIKDKNQDQCIILLSYILNSMNSKWDINNSILYSHLDLQSANLEDYSSFIIPSFISELKNESEYDFLKNNEDFINLLKKYESN